MTHLFSSFSQHLSPSSTASQTKPRPRSAPPLRKPQICFHHQQLRVSPMSTQSKPAILISGDGDDISYSSVRRLYNGLLVCGLLHGVFASVHIVSFHWIGHEFNTDKNMMPAFDSPPGTGLRHGLLQSQQVALSFGAVERCSDVACLHTLHFRRPSSGSKAG